jgi:hypothetical protein
VSQSPTTSGPLNRAAVAHSLVQLGLLLTLVWKWRFFIAASRVYADFPLEDPFFPDWLRSASTVTVAFLLAVAAIALNLIIGLTVAFLLAVAAISLNLIIGCRPLQRLCSWLTLATTSILCIHQASYNDMTFVTAWWTSVWSLWYVYHLDDDDQAGMLRRAAFLSRLIISVILLGGALGKWTAEYWSGEVLFDIYFRDRNFWVFNLLRANFQTDVLREIAVWYSRVVVLTETVAGLGLWLLPPRAAAALGVVLLSSIALFSNFLLFSVLWCLIALAAVGFFVPGKAGAGAETVVGSALSNPR